jgi:hypothetical protein
MQIDIWPALFKYDVKKGLSLVNKSAGWECQNEMPSNFGVGEMEWEGAGGKLREFNFYFHLNEVSS